MAESFDGWGTSQGDIIVMVYLFLRSFGLPFSLTAF